MAHQVREPSAKVSVSMPFLVLIISILAILALWISSAHGADNLSCGIHSFNLDIGADDNAVIQKLIRLIRYVIQAVIDIYCAIAKTFGFHCG